MVLRVSMRANGVTFRMTVGTTPMKFHVNITWHAATSKKTFVYGVKGLMMTSTGSDTRAVLHRFPLGHPGTIPLVLQQVCI